DFPTDYRYFRPELTRSSFDVKTGSQHLNPQISGPYRKRTRLISCYVEKCITFQINIAANRRKLTCVIGKSSSRLKPYGTTIGKLLFVNLLSRVHDGSQ